MLSLNHEIPVFIGNPGVVTERTLDVEVVPLPKNKLNKQDLVI